MNRYLIVLVLSLFAVACGDDDDSSNGDKSKADASTVDEDAGSGFGSVACHPAGSGACQNTADCPIVESGKARKSASDCGLTCLAGTPDEQTMCAKTCVVDDTKLSSDCAECYVGIVGCSRDHCLAACLADPDSKACFDCQVENGCRATFDECSGLPPVEMP
jgi:hypothetical protein